MRRLLSFTLWSAVVLAPAAARAQPERRPAPTATVHVGGRWPTEAPPPSREEKAEAAKSGETWVKGRWDWKSNKWEWMAGHWERERAGKHWREAHWEKRNDHFELEEGVWEDGGGVPANVTAGTWPTEAPPPSREEKVEAAKAGEIWAKGRWDWKNGKWEWMAGHWERERPNKRWREASWEKKEGHYVVVEGSWEDGGAPIPPPPGEGEHHEGDHRDGDRRDGAHRREWKIDRPAVSSYWPTKGKAGARIVVRGQNFPADAMVMFAGQPVKGAKVTSNEIEFHVPEGAPSGEIALRTIGEHRRDLMVGAFEVKADYDVVAEQRRLDDEHHKLAEANWAARQAKFAKDRIAREAEVEKRWKDMDGSREERRERRNAEIRAKWDAAFLRDPDTQNELTLHAERVAKITRMHDVAEINGDSKLGIRIDIASQREAARHEVRMQALHASFGKEGAK